MNFACSVARVEYSRASVLQPDHTQHPEASVTLHETRKRATKRLLEAVLKGARIALLLVACALLVYLGAVLLARGRVRYWSPEFT
jgi:hypothetical protein